MSSTSKAILGIIGGLTLLFGALIFFAETVSPSFACNVNAYELKGELVTSVAFAGVDEDGLMYQQSYSEDIVAGIEESNEDEAIKAILIEVDSPGGSPVAGEEIASAIERSDKPVFAIVRSIGTSAAYWAIAPAKRIFASRNADVGGIGVVVSYLDQVEKNEKEGYRYNTVTSGKYKLLGDPNAKLSEEERAILQRDVDIVHQNFVQAISEYRALPLPEVEGLADGSTMLGSMALEHGLIDEIGDLHVARAYITEEIGDDVRICEYDEWNE